MNPFYRAVNDWREDAVDEPTPTNTQAIDDFYGAVSDWRSDAVVSPTRRYTNVVDARPQTQPQAPQGYYPQPQSYYQQPRQTQGPAPRPAEPPRSTYKVDPLKAAISRWQSSTRPEPVQYEVPSYQFDYEVERPDTGPSGFTAQQTQSPTVTLQQQRYDPLSSAYQPPQREQPRYDPLSSTYQPPTGTGQSAPASAAMMTAWLPAAWNWARPYVQQAADSYANSRASQVAQDITEQGPKGTIDDWIPTTPGGKYAEDNRQWRATHGAYQPDGNGEFSFWTPLDYAKDATLNTLEPPFYAYEKAVETTEIPGTRFIADLITGESGGDISAGQALSVLGEAFNRTYNKLNPNYAPGTEEFDGSYNLPAIHYDIFKDALNRSRAARARVEELGPGADMALVNLISGGDRTVAGAEAIVNQEADVAQLRQDAQTFAHQALVAEQQGDMELAADYYLRSSQANVAAEVLANKTKTELLDEQMNPWAEFLGSVALDPTNLIDFSPIVRGVKSAMARRAFDMTDDAAIKVLEEATNPALVNAVEQAPGTLLDRLAGASRAEWLRSVNPFARTTETKAIAATDALYRAGTQILTDINDKETARFVLGTWATDPKQLVRGVATPKGNYSVGGGVIANEYVTPHYPILKQVVAKLVGMESLAGSGGFNPIEVLSELHETLYRGARATAGLDDLVDVPPGTVRARLVKTTPGNAVIEYVGKKGKVVGRSEEMLASDATTMEKGLRKALRQPKAGSVVIPVAKNKIVAGLQTAWNIQKGILSDMFLGLNPGYWAKNSASAAVHLTADNNMTLLPTDQIINDFGMWYGGPGTSRILAAETDAMGGLAQEVTGGQHWLERIIGKNPYSDMMNYAYDIPYGGKSIAKGRIPIGEQNNALRGTYVATRREIVQEWGNVAKMLGQAIESAGVDAETAQALAAFARDAGINGGKQNIVAEVRKAVTAKALKVSLSDLQVPEELLSAENWRKLQEVINTYDPTQAAEAAQQVRAIFVDEFGKNASILKEAPPQPSRAVYSAVESAGDHGDMIDGVVEAATKAGEDVPAAKKAAEDLAKQISDAELAQWGKIRAEVAASTDPRAANAALDLLAQWYEWRAAARRGVDELYQAVRADGFSDVAWRNKFQGTMEIYSKFLPWFDEQVKTVRHSLLTGQPTGYDWFKAYDRYAAYDEFAIQAERASGAVLQSPGSNDDLYSTVIAANREFVDSKVVELFSAFKRYPSGETLDLVADGLRKVEEIGQQTAAFMATQRAAMLRGDLPLQQFYDIRNRAWTQSFDNAAVYAEVTKRHVVARGVAETVTSNLRWTDDFAGGEFQLIGKSKDGYWEARNVTDNTLHQFADPYMLERERKAGVVVASMPEVPKEIVSDFYQAIGNVEATVDEAIQEIAESLPVVQPPPRELLPREKRGEYTLYTEGGKAPETRTTTYVGDTEPSVLEPGSTPIPSRQAAAQPPSKPNIPKTRTGYTATDISKAWQDYVNTEGLPPIDEMAERVAKGKNALTKKDLNKMSGRKIAGYNLTDHESINRMVREYSTVREQWQAGLQPVLPSASEHLAGPSRDVVPERLSIVDETLTEAPVQKPPATVQPPQATAPRPPVDIEPVIAPTPYTLRNDVEGLNHLGIPANENAYEFTKALNAKADRLAGEKVPEMGEVASHNIRTLTATEQKLLDNLETILAGKPNMLTPAQKLIVIDELEKVLPVYDNILAAALKVGEDAANFAMLNYADRRNFDAWLSQTFPFHFYWSRTPKNWVKRVAQKPSILNNYYRGQRAIAAENEQNNVPDHLRGTLQNPLPFGPQRLQNPSTWLFPFEMATGSDFVDVDSARSEVDRWKLTVEKYLPSVQPVIKFAADAALDQFAPLANGVNRTDSYQLGDYIPIWKAAAYGYQAQTGNIISGPLAGGDEYDYGRAGKQVSLQEVRGDIRPGQASWGNDVGYQRQNDVDPLPEQPEGAALWWKAGSQRAGYERLMNTIMRLFTGIGVYYVSDAEIQMRDMKADRAALGYNPVTNTYGSRAAVNERTTQEGDIYDGSFNYGVLYPGSQGRRRPGVAAATNDYWNMVNPQFDEMGEAADEYLTENPNASSRDINEIKGPYWDEIAAIGETFPSVPNKVGEKETFNKPRNVKHMNPAERAEYEVKLLLDYKPGNAPTYPGEDAEAAELQQYYKDKAVWDIKRLTQIDRNLNQLYSGEMESYPSDWLEIAKELMGGKYSSELMRINSVRNAGLVEKAWSERQSFVEEVSDAEFRNRTKAVTERLGEDGESLYNEYLSLPKGSEERDDFKDENPAVDIALFAAFNTQEYDAFVEKFGEDALIPVYLERKPQYPDNPNDEAAMQAYYKRLDTYNKTYPIAEEANLWVKGRRFGPEAPDDKFGRGYDEAVSIFGEDIFDVIRSFPSGGTKAQISAWYKRNGAKADLMSAYRAWKGEHGDEDAAATGDYPEDYYPGNATAGQGYSGPRPVGRDFVPVGENRWWEEQEPNQWATMDWGTVAASQSDDPWTQRANELNASLFGDESIPSEMAGMVDEDGNPLVDSYAPSSKSAAEYVKASSGGRGYSSRRPWVNYGRSSRGYSRRGYGG